MTMFAFIKLLPGPSWPSQHLVLSPKMKHSVPTTSSSYLLMGFFFFFFKTQIQGAQDWQLHPGFRMLCRNMVDDPRKYNTVEGPPSQPKPLKLIKDRTNHNTWGGNKKAGVVRGVMFMGSCKGDIILYWLRPHALVFTLVTTSPGHICHGSGFHALPHPWASSIFVPLS